MRTMSTAYPPPLERNCPWCRRPVYVVYIKGHETRQCRCPPRQDFWNKRDLDHSFRSSGVPGRLASFEAIIAR
jgi:hypothetical protein